MRYNKFLLAIIAANGALAAINGRCSSGNGVCVTTANCSKAGGTYKSNFCPNDPADVKCCNKDPCTVNGKTGVCKFTSDCSGETLAGACPGGNDFKCCIESNPSGGGGNNGNAKTLVTTLLMFEEGTNPKGVCVPYIDSLNYPTIGYGQLCKSTKVSTQAQANSACSSYTNGCTAQKAKQWLSNQIDTKTNCMNSYTNIKNAYNNASEKRKAIIISMAYQLGCAGLASFKDTLNSMANGNWSKAADNMLDSKWARQTPDRANRHAYVIRNNACGNFCSYYGW